jgi:hypothetical protein
MGPNQYGQLEFQEGPKGKEGDVAAFRVQHWSPGMLTQLPAPTQPFGLHFQVSYPDLEQDKVRTTPENDLTDAGLKDSSSSSNSNRFSSSPQNTLPRRA